MSASRSITRFSSSLFFQNQASIVGQMEKAFRQSMIPLGSAAAESKGTHSERINPLTLILNYGLLGENMLIMKIQTMQEQPLT